MPNRRAKQYLEQARTSTLTLRVAPDEAERLRAAAADRGISLSVMFAEALAQYVPGSLTEHVVEPVEDIAC